MGVSLTLGVQSVECESIRQELRKKVSSVYMQYQS